MKTESIFLLFLAAVLSFLGYKIYQEKQKKNTAIQNLLATNIGAETLIETIPLRKSPEVLTTPVVGWQESGQQPYNYN